MMTSRKLRRTEIVTFAGMAKGGAGFARTVRIGA